MHSEAAARVDFRSILRYAQSWEDADILLEALDVEPGDTCLSVASAGDNTFSLLSRGPARVIAVDINPVQLAAVELRAAAYRTLSHGELLELIGSRPSGRRLALYARCRAQLSAEGRRHWDARPDAVRDGVGGAGRFERYFRIFRERVLPLVHRRRTVLSLLEPRTRAERRAFYDETWDTIPWRLLFRVFFSGWMLGRLGRDPGLLRYAEGGVAGHLLRRVRHALAELDPAENPYVGWILTGEHPRALPHALRAEHFDAIRENLDRLELRRTAIEALDPDSLGAPIDAANLSDVFEYLSPENARALFGRVADLARPGARLAYWNMIVPRHGAGYLPERLRRKEELSRRLFAQDKAFFYSDFVVDEVLC